TLLFRGELTAEEDVILQGRVEGSIRHARSLIIGTDGSVMGDVYAAHLTVEGLVEGDLHGSEAGIVKATAQGGVNIYARVVGIMEGAASNGRGEMDGNPAAASRSAKAPARPNAAPAGTPARPAAGAPRASGNPPASGSASAPGAALPDVAVDQ